jgi:hypothetical protein
MESKYFDEKLIQNIIWKENLENHQSNFKIPKKLSFSMMNH